MWTVDEEMFKSIIKKGLELGINFYDTAIAYQAVTSEEYLGNKRGMLSISICRNPNCKRREC